MEYFVPVVVRTHNALGVPTETKEETQWSSFKSIGENPLPGVVNDVCFSPKAPYELAAAADLSVSLFDTSTGQIRRTLGKFKDTAHSPFFKPDGRLLVAGSENGVAQVFDLSNKSILRQFKGHTEGVWTSQFTTDGLQVMTGSDDSTVKMWDLATGKNLRTLRDATDYVRSLSASPSAKHMWCAGSYDKTARIYDLRTNSVLFSLEHGNKIDDVLVLPGGVRAITVGAEDVKVWDFFSGGRLVSKLSNHAKAVTCCAFDSVSNRLLTGGLDGQVKIQDLSDFEIKGVMYYSSPIVSLAISSDGKRIGTGSTDGTVEIRVQKDLQKDVSQLQPRSGLKDRPFAGWGRGFERADNDGPAKGTLEYYKSKTQAQPYADEVIIGERMHPVLEQHDKYLKEFEYGKALESAIETKKLKVIRAVCEELFSRRGLGRAIANQSEDNIVFLMQLIHSNIEDPVHSAWMCQLCNHMLDVLSSEFGQSSRIDSLLHGIYQKVRQGKFLRRKLCMLEGSVDAIMNASQAI